ncbi:hypothetical protein B0H10DRAFT_2208096 [Mycena sp. CBHHK59/15]|nr:hypothetical protein B0H10DRAFT_2208096 [Mycena sp. CBHHK59/15]
MRSTSTHENGFPSQIKLGFVYADNIATGVEIGDHLEELLPLELRGQGLIRPYNAALSKEYWREAMQQFRDGKIRILVCTNTAGMGCNIPNIELAARADSTTGLAVLLVEPSAYGVDVEEQAAITQGKGKRGKDASESEAAKKKMAQKRKAHAQARDTPRLDPEVADEGLHVLVQAGTCRRGVSTQIYNNEKPAPTVPCCDICCPTLLDLTRTGNLRAAQRQSANKRGVANKDIQVALDRWRTGIVARDYLSGLYSSSVILHDETIALLSSVGPIESMVRLETILSGQWLGIDEYGDALYQYLAGLDIPPMQPLPKKTRAPKHPHPDAKVPQNAVVEGSASTRRRVDVAPAGQQSITAQTSPTVGTSSNRGNPTAAPRRGRGRGRGRQQTAEEIRAEFSREEPKNPLLSMLFTRQSRYSSRGME